MLPEIVLANHQRAKELVLTSVKALVKSFGNKHTNRSIIQYRLLLIQVSYYWASYQRNYYNEIILLFTGHCSNSLKYFTQSAHLSYPLSNPHCCLLRKPSLDQSILNNFHPVTSWNRSWKKWLITWAPTGSLINLSEVLGWVIAL